MKKVLSHLASPLMDTNKKKSTHGDSVFVLDGIRGLAVLLVIASHCDAFWMSGQGSLGVLLFFALSGYVLTLPFLNNQHLIFNYRQLINFFINRALRIYPAFIVTLICLFLFWHKDTENLYWITKQIFFLCGWNHLWSVVQEARFYIIFPIVIAILSILPMRLRIPSLIFFIIMAYSFRFSAPVNQMDYGDIQFYFWFFLSGMLACHITNSSIYKIRKYSCIFDIFSSIIITMIIFSSNAWIELFGKLFNIQEILLFNGWHQPVMWCFMFIILLIGLVGCQTNITSRFMSSWIMRHIGLMSYGLYLFHVPIIMFLRPYNIKQNTLFFHTIVLAYLVAYASYVLIEKPFLMLKPRQ